MRRSLIRGALVAVLAAAAACGDDPQPIDPSPSPNPITETYTGTVTVNGAVTWGNIIVTSAGSANAVLRAVRPQLTMRVSDGSGNYVAGETVYIGNSLDDRTGIAVVHGWDPATGTLFLNDRDGTLPTGEFITGATSGARWVNREVGNTVLGLALGTWSGTTCSIVLANDIAGEGAQVTGVVRDAGTLCVRVYDVGRLRGPAEVTVEVSHF
jgi:hypothetical protein